MDPILALAKKHNLRIVEDCAQAHGALYKGRTIGSIGDMACFSFYPGKNLGAYGDAGALVTSDEVLAKKARMFANHGRVDKYDHEMEGINSRLDGLQAAILGVKLKHLDAWSEARRKNAYLYNKHLKWNRTYHARRDSRCETSIPSLCRTNKKGTAPETSGLFEIKRDMPQVFIIP